MVYLLRMQASRPVARLRSKYGPETSASDSRVEEPEILGAVVFLTALPDHIARRTTIRLNDGELWAWVGERNVRLGRPIDMDAKAAALEAIIDSAPPGVIDLIAPSRPAVWSEDGDQSQTLKVNKKVKRKALLMDDLNA